MSSLEFDLVDLKFVVEALLVFSSEIAVDLYLCEFVVSYCEFEVVCDGNSRWYIWCDGSLGVGFGFRFLSLFGVIWGIGFCFGGGDLIGLGYSLGFGNFKRFLGDLIV